MTLALVQRLAVRGDLDEEAPAGLKVPAHKVVKDDHVVLLGKLDVVGDVLQDLGHEHEAALDVGRRLVLYNAHLHRRHDGRVDEAQEHDGAHGANVRLLAAREALAQDL